MSIVPETPLNPPAVTTSPDLMPIRANKEYHFQALLTSEQWAYSIDRIAEVGNVRAVARQLGVTASTIFGRARIDREYDALMRGALADYYMKEAQSVLPILDGEEDYTSGSEKRDEMRAKYRMELAKVFAPKYFAPAPLINANSVNITIASPDQDM